jgi:shikimate kinase
MENVLPDVGREQQEQLDQLRSVFRKRDELYRRFRTAIFRAEQEDLRTRVMEWIPLSNN